MSDSNSGSNFYAFPKKLLYSAFFINAIAVFIPSVYSAYDGGPEFSMMVLEDARRQLAEHEEPDKNSSLQEFYQFRAELWWRSFSELSGKQVGIIGRRESTIWIVAFCNMLIFSHVIWRKVEAGKKEEAEQGN